MHSVFAPRHNHQHALPSNLEFEDTDKGDQMWSYEEFISDRHESEPLTRDSADGDGFGISVEQSKQGTITAGETAPGPQTFSVRTQDAPAMEEPKEEEDLKLGEIERDFGSSRL